MQVLDALGRVLGVLAGFGEDKRALDHALHVEGEALGAQLRARRIFLFSLFNVFGHFGGVAE